MKTKRIIGIILLLICFRYNNEIYISPNAYVGDLECDPMPTEEVFVEDPADEEMAARIDEMITKHRFKKQE